MKNLNIIFAIFVLIFNQSIFAASVNTDFNGDNPPKKERKITIKRGTKITLQLNDNVSSQENELGNVVEMMVMMDVKVNGKTVVASGTFAEGLVTDARRAGIFGKGGRIELEGINIRSIDGQRIPIKSVKVKKQGKNRKGMAWGMSILIPAAGILMGTPMLAPFAIVGLFVKGREIDIEAGTLVTAKILEDVIVIY